MCINKLVDRRKHTTSWVHSVCSEIKVQVDAKMFAFFNTFLKFYDLGCGPA